ncbi:AAA family ATPase [Sulfitobacter sp.]|uniref:AAA family ATPase n=1 Tax=Sulfitobacter sp. TaxID=1903071 RepID=UPI003EF3C6B2
MKRIKIIDVPHYETDPKVIVKQLSKFLEDFRKKKVALDLIGDDERSAEFNVSDIEIFGDDLSDGVELTYMDTWRITARANKLAKDRVAAAGVSHLKREEYDRLEPSLAGMQVIMAKDQNWADEVAAKLHADMPWMARATEYAWHALRRSAQRGEPALIRPVILNGPPGIGKSVWARSLAAALDVPYADVDATKGGAGMSLVGVERGWATAQAGRPLDLMLSKRLANPLIIVDEVCKARSVTSIKGTSYAFADALLSLLEPATAKAWDCPYFRVRFDMSHISWVLTSNSAENVPETVRSRCQMIEIPDLKTEQLQEFAVKKGLDFGLSEAAVEAVLMAVDQAPLITGQRLSLRDVVRMLERAEMLEGRPRLQ